MDEIVNICGLAKKYGGYEAVKGINLQIGSSEIFSLLGPNGAGKTTTIRMLMGMLKTTAGSASILGMDCFTRRAEIMRYVGYLPDEPIFYDYLRGSEILRFVGNMHGLAAGTIMERSSSLLHKFDLAGAVEDYAVNYSRGMKKKLAFICAMLHEPRLLILDEPTNGLDPYATRTMHEIIRQFKVEGRSIFLSTHLLDQAEKLCDRVGILHDGNLAACGRMEDLRSMAEDDKTLEDIFFAVTAVVDKAGGSDA